VAGAVVLGVVAAVSVPVVSCLCWTRTFGPLTEGCGCFAMGRGACVVLVGVVVCVVVLGGVLTGVVVVLGAALVGVVSGVVAVVLVWVGADGAGVVVVPVGGAPPLGGSAASAPPDNGPFSPTAVSPPPASAERITRRTFRGTGRLKGASSMPDMLGPCSFVSRPMVAFEQDVPVPREPPDPIHIGREARLRKGFVIGAINSA
jgi:hypothetical protein